MGGDANRVYEATMNSETDSLFTAALSHGETLKRRRLVLYAGANQPSQAVLAAHAPALSAMPSMGPSFHKDQPGTELVSQFEVAIRDATCALFRAEWAEQIGRAHV